MTDLPDQALTDLLEHAEDEEIIDDYEVGDRVVIQMGSLDLAFEKERAPVFIRGLIRGYRRAEGDPNAGRR